MGSRPSRGGSASASSGVGVSSLVNAFDMLTGRSQSISLEEQGPGGAGRDGSMADARFLLIGELGEGSAQRRIEEYRVVAEAAATPRRFRDHTLHHALHHALASPRIDERDDGAKAGGARRARAFTEH